MFYIVSLRRNQYTIKIDLLQNGSTYIACGLSRRLRVQIRDTNTNRVGCFGHALRFRISWSLNSPIQDTESKCELSLLLGSPVVAQSHQDILWTCCDNRDTPIHKYLVAGAPLAATASTKVRRQSKESQV